MKNIVCVLALAMITLSNNSSASLLDGQTLAFSEHFPTVTVQSGTFPYVNYTVGSGIEKPNWFGDARSYIDFSDSQIKFAFGDVTYYSGDPGLIAFFGGGPSFNGYQMRDIYNRISPFTSVTVNTGSSNLPFILDTSRIFYDSNNIYVNFEGLSFKTGETLVLNINSPVSPVPEMNFGLMLLLGLPAIWMATRRRMVGQMSC